ncbi:hypothetical protein Tco_0785255 [Tanacetum coccineum]
MAFVSSSNNNIGSSNEAINAAHRVTTASTQVNAANLSDVVIYEMDLRWQMAMLTSEGLKGFLKDRGRKLTSSKKPRQQEQGKLKKECALWKQLLPHLGCRCDGLGGIRLDVQAEEWPNYALMAYSS